jgi:hypothetical protein
MAKSSLFLWGGIAAGGYLLYKAYQKAMAAQMLFYSIRRIRYISTDLSKTTLELELGVSNLSNESLAYDRFFGQIRYNGNVLVSVTNDGRGKGIVIKPMNETSISIPVTIFHIQAVLTLKDLITKLIAKQNIEGLVMQGTLYAGGIGVPITQNLSLNFNNPSPVVKGIGCPAYAVGGVLN